MENIYLPDLAVIDRIVDETHDIKTFTLSLISRELRKNFRFKPGQFVEAYIATNGQRALAIPADAVALMNGAATVFKLEGEELHPTAVQIGKTRGAWTEVTGGVAEGDEIAVTNVFQLKSTLLKSQMGEGHGH